MKRELSNRRLLEILDGIDTELRYSQLTKEEKLKVDELEQQRQIMQEAREAGN